MCLIDDFLSGSKKKSPKLNENKDTASSLPPASIEEPLDLADLDLSRLRLSKKDLETLSSITPGLPKCFQEQLLAKLPPTQARKLSRTLSMQNSTHVPTVRVYKRSQSGGRNMTTIDTERFTPNELRTELDKKLINDSKSNFLKLSDSSRDESSDRNHSLIYRRSLSRGRYDYENVQDLKNRSHSVCRISDDNTSKSLCSSYSSDVSEKYKYYSPYLTKGRDSESSSISPYKRYESISPRDNCLSPTKEFNNRLIGERMSPTSDSHRRYGRYLRQESGEDSRSSVEKKQRERETHSVLREIKEKSRESSRDRLSQSMELDPTLGEVERKPDTNIARHVRNKSLEIYADTKETTARTHVRSKSRDLPDNTLQTEELASKILEELQALSSAKTRKDKIDENSSTAASREVTSEKVVVKKIRKIKPKEKAADSSVSTLIEIAPNAEKELKTTVVKKVKKVIKRTETKAGEEKTKALTLESSTPKSDMEKPKRESKLKRPKSFPTKDGAEKASEPNSTTTTENNDSSTTESKIPQVKTANADTSPEGRSEPKLIRPKSYPASKLTPPKDIKRILSSPPEKDSTTKPQIPKRSSVSEEKSMIAKSSDSPSPTDCKPPPTTTTTIKRVVKVTRKSKITSPTLTPKTPVTDTDSKLSENSLTEALNLKEKSPEKKVGKGLLYAIGQKFEKLRDSAKSQKKIITKVSTSSTNALNNLKTPDDVPKEKLTLLKKKKAKSTAECCQNEKSDEKTDEKPVKTETTRRSRIDAMIRSLRDRSVPRTPVLTESNLIKRAVSVEEMPGTFNKCTVNRVLGLFKRFEKDGSGDRKVRSTRSTSNIERQLHKSDDSPIYQNRDRPKSGGFLSKVTKNSNNIILVSKPEDQNGYQPQKHIVTTKKKETSTNDSCPDCKQQNHQEPNKNLSSKTLEKDEHQQTAKNNSNKDTIKDKRKTLVLDFTKLDKIDNNIASTMRQNSIINGNTVHNASYNDNACNNNNIRASSNEINRNHIYNTPTNDNITNYSSDSRSYQDDCASTSTFLSPTDEPELCFDNWSVCSEDNYMLATPSPTVSRLSRTSHYSSPTHPSDGNESVIDRIKRRSFYSRFNEKRPKRQSSIVGPGARDYYRESSVSKPPKQSSDRQSSPDITKEFFRPLKLSPAGSELKPPVYRSTPGTTTSDTSKSSSSSRRFENLHTSSSPSFLSKRYTIDNDYLGNSSSITSRTKPLTTSTYEQNGSSSTTQPTSFYSTYNPKRRSSYNLNGSVPGSSSVSNHNVDGYATVGRRSTLRPYDHRTMSLLDPIGQSSTSMIGTYRRDYRVPISADVGNFSRTRSNYRSTSVTRSPTNI